jgi:hypothetical protein
MNRTSEPSMLEVVGCLFKIADLHPHTIRRKTCPRFKQYRQSTVA